MNLDFFYITKITQWNMLFNEKNRPDPKYLAGVFDSLREIEGCFAISGTDLKPDICTILKFWYLSHGICIHKHFYFYFFLKNQLLETM